jgi:hypothetical protein
MSNQTVTIDVFVTTFINKDNKNYTRHFTVNENMTIWEFSQLCDLTIIYSGQALNVNVRLCEIRPSQGPTVLHGIVR